MHKSTTIGCGTVMTQDPVQRVMSTWDAVVTRALDGDSSLPFPLDSWFSSLHQSYGTPANGAALPEPFLGSLERRPAGVFLTATPGRAFVGSHGRPDFQSPTGVFAHEIRTSGSYSAWAASNAYLRPPWTSVVSATGIHQRRVQFLRHWHGDDRLDAGHLVTFALYPWHTSGITTRLRPEPDLVRAYVLEPLLALGSPTIFTFGSPWFTILPAFGFTLEALVGFGGVNTTPTNRTRAVGVFRGLGGLQVIAERHPGSPYPPPAEGVTQMQKALANLSVTF